jgi:acyl dehydratase
LTRSLHLRFSSLPAGLLNYPRLLFTDRPPVNDVESPPEITATVENVLVSAASVTRYLKVCGYEADAAVPLTYPHILAMPLHLKIFATSAFPLRPMGLIHLSNEIQALGEIKPGAKFDVSVTARNYRPMDAGLAFDMATEITREGRPVWLENCVFLSRWSEPVTHAGTRMPRPPRAPKNCEVLDEYRVTLGTAWDYARVSDDYNPIHLNDRAARFFGLRGAIVHGMWSLARSLAQAPSPELPAGTRVQTQFVTPVQLPSRVVIKQWSADSEIRRAMCDEKKGRVHMYSHWPAT